MNFNLIKHIYLFLFALLFITSCTGQDGTTLQKETTESHSIEKTHPEIVKTVGTGQFGSVSYGFMDSSGNLWFSTSDDGVYRYVPSAKDGGTGSFVHYTTEDGLNSNAVGCAIEDKAGNILFGTKRGISRYNPSNDPTLPGAESVDGGQAFVVFTENTAISSATISLLLEDSKGRLWACDYQNGNYETCVYLYDPASEQADGLVFRDFLKIESVQNENDLTLLRTNGIVEDAAGNIWFCGQNRDNLSCFDGTRLVQHKFTDPPGPAAPGYRSMIQDKFGQLWLGTHWNGVVKYVPPEGAEGGKALINGAASFIKFNDDPGRPSPYMAILEDSKGYIWFCNDDAGVWRYDPAAEQAVEPAYKNFRMGNNNVFSAVEDRDGNIWFGTRQTGLYRFDGNAFVKFSN